VCVQVAADAIPGRLATNSAAMSADAESKLMSLRLDSCLGGETFLVATMATRYQAGLATCWARAGDRCWARVPFAFLISCWHRSIDLERTF
jgi:hypothetical protein